MKILSAIWLQIFFILEFFMPAHFFVRAFFNPNRYDMQLTLFENNDNTKIVLYKLSRIVYAETLASSLQFVEAFASMIYNIHIKYAKSFESIANDEDIFDVLNENSLRHKYLDVEANNRKFQMCLRVVQTMMRGNLRDSVFGATKYHHVDVMPGWAISRGYIAECEDILFYL